MSNNICNKDMENYAGYYYLMMRDSLIISPEGDLDHHMADGMREEIDSVIQDKCVRSIIFDFAGIEFMDSSGIGFIIGRYRQMRQRGVIAIVNPTPGIRRILRISGLHKLVSVYPDLESAIVANETRIRKDSVKN